MDLKPLLHESSAPGDVVARGNLCRPAGDRARDLVERAIDAVDAGDGRPARQVRSMTPP